MMNNMHNLPIRIRIILGNLILKLLLLLHIDRIFQIKGSVN
jgi:hypothetical protein